MEVAKKFEFYKKRENVKSIGAVKKIA